MYKVPKESADDPYFSTVLEARAEVTGAKGTDAGEERVRDPLKAKAPISPLGAELASLFGDGSFGI